LIQLFFLSEKYKLYKRLGQGEKKEITWAKGKEAEGVYWRKMDLVGLDFSNRKR
jgi:hypothetical protein